VILGTAACVNPEQARGKALDKRMDILSFGCVLFEAITGRLVFKGETISDSIAAILKNEPDWNAIPSTTPMKVRDLLRRCLQKSTHNRLHDIAPHETGFIMITDESQSEKPAQINLILNWAEELKRFVQQEGN
jgi:serine/threonine protein kinase